MRFVSLCSGVGGFDLGLERAGHSCLGQAELDPFRSAVLHRRWPTVRRVRDVRAVRPDTFGRADLLVAGFPCRDLSVVGRRRGLEGTNEDYGSGLFFEVVRVADDLLGPGGWLLLENVPGLLSSNGGRDFAVLLATLAERGFHDLAWRVLDSRLHGVAQQRRRVFILARRARGEARARSVLLDPPAGGGDPDAGGEAGAGAPGSGAPGDEDAARLIDAGLITRALTARLGTSGWDLTDAEGNLMVDDGYGLRRLTPVELERLQGFPDGWTDLGGTPDAPRYEAMGRAVTVPVAEAIGRRLPLG